jgi:hypothetical protein
MAVFKPKKYDEQLPAILLYFHLNALILICHCDHEERSGKQSQDWNEDFDKVHREILNWH